MFKTTILLYKHKRLIFCLCLLFLVSSPICVGQTRAIHIDIRGVRLGQKISPELIRERLSVDVHPGLFHLYSQKMPDGSYQSMHEYDSVANIKDIDFLGQYGENVDYCQLRFRDGVLRSIMFVFKAPPMPAEPRDYLRIDNKENNELFQHLYYLLYSQYGIWDRALASWGNNAYEDDPDDDMIQGVKGNSPAYLWSGVNGVNLILYKHDRYCYLEYRITKSYTSSPSRAAIISDKLDGSSL